MTAALIVAASAARPDIRLNKDAGLDFSLVLLRVCCSLFGFFTCSLCLLDLLYAVVKRIRARSASTAAATTVLIPITGVLGVAHV